jgi:hypothetical protein
LYGRPDWYGDRGRVFTAQTAADLRAARRRAAACGRTESAGRIVAELPFGFWRFLLCNRIAHHEPIHNRPLGELHAVALTTAGWICPTTRDWIAGRSRVPALLADRENDSDPGRLGW